VKRDQDRFESHLQPRTQILKHGATLGEAILIYSKAASFGRRLNPTPARPDPSGIRLRDHERCTKLSQVGYR
jgi:hypothetical protein